MMTTGPATAAVHPIVGRRVVRTTAIGVVVAATVVHPIAVFPVADLQTIGNSKILIMKKLLLHLLFSASLNSFSQAPDTTQPLNQFSIIKFGDTIQSGSMIGTIDTKTWALHYKFDTLRATLIVYYDSGPAILHTKPGFVVTKGWSIDGYLDDKKRVIKAPWEVLTYRIKK